MEQLLDLEGYQVYTAANGREGVERLTVIERPCLILLDLMMPVMNGWEFMDHLRKSDTYSGIPILVVTAAGNQRAGDLHKVALLRKPVEIETLLTAIHKFCEHKTRSA